MSGITLCILGGTFASNIFYIATYNGSGGPEFHSLAVDSTNSYFSGRLSGGAGVELTFVKLDNKGLLVEQYRKYKPSDSVNVWSGSSSTSYVYLTGYETDASNIFYGTLIKANKTDGATQWIKRIRNSGTTYSRGVAIDSSDNSYVFTATTFSRPGGVLVKYNSGGTLQWQKQVGGGGAGTDEVDARGLALDSANNVYVTGAGGASGTNSIFLIKCDSSGTLQWQRQLVFSDQSRGVGVKTDSSNNVYIASWAIVSGSQCIVTAKYDSSGTFQWQQQIVYAQTSLPGQSNNTTVIDVDSSGNVYVFGETYVTPIGYRWVILKYNSSGTLQWQRQFYPTNNNNSIYANSIIVDNLGSFTLCGQGTTRSWAVKLPVTGALTGSYTIGSIDITYEASSGTASSASGSSSTPSYTFSNSSISDVDGAFVYTEAVSLTYTRLQIP